MTDLLLTYPQAGFRLAVSADTIRRLVRRGKLHAVYPCARPRIAVSELDRYIREISAPNILQWPLSPAAAGRLSRHQAKALLK
ncbi:MAG TPA: helix-turn-helix domain-containing protein [Candidatus Competibacteraceae bacterium]|nr:helix-turn-helix domain-containing protein [Candidatus Competibacteraceae bacterium]